MAAHTAWTADGLPEDPLAPSFAEMRWSEIVDLYSMLERIAPSPLHTLNKAVAVAEWQGPAAGLSVRQDRVSPSWLAGSGWPLSRCFERASVNATSARLSRWPGDEDALDRGMRCPIGR
jgi:hypothetical protein